MGIHQQRGSVLLVSLVMLLILTIVGIASISGVGMTEKMVNSQKDYDVAFEMAEAALVQGERWLDDYDSGFDAAHVNTGCTGSTCWTENCTGGLCFRGEHDTNDSICLVDGSGTPVWESASIWAAGAATYTKNVAAVEPPKYLIEFLCYTPLDIENASDVPPYGSDWARIYRVTALAYGTRPETRVMIQSTYRVD